MPACYVCRAQDATVRFPKSESVKSQWVTSLTLTTTPYDGARLCLRHFAPTDIIITPGGRKNIRKGAISSSEAIEGNSDSIHHDHSYSFLSNSMETLSISGMMTLATLCMCLFPFLLLLCYCSTSGDYSRPVVTKHNRIATPVTTGECYTIITPLTMNLRF